MDKTPFSVYDFFSYLSAGFIWIVDIDFLFGSNVILKQNYNWQVIVFLIIIAYILGHINSHIAAWLLEGKIVGILGYPSKNLFSEEKKKYKIFNEFRKPFPSSVLDQILTKYYDANTGNRFPGEAMFLYCYYTVKEKSSPSYARLQSFLNLYGFSRNISFALAMVAVSFIIKGFETAQSVFFLWALLLAVGSFALFLRFLKFYRHFSIEVFMSYLCIKDK